MQLDELQPASLTRRSWLWGRILVVLAIGLVVLAAIRFVGLSAQRNRVELMLLGYKQFVKGGRIFVELALTNGTKDEIKYFANSDVVPEIPLLVSLMTNGGWVTRLQRGHGDPMVHDNWLLPGRQITFLVPAILGVDPYRAGVFCDVPIKPYPNRLARWLNEGKSWLRMALRITAPPNNLYWCPTLLAPPQEMLQSVSPAGAPQDQ